MLTVAESRTSEVVVADGRGPAVYRATVHYCIEWASTDGEANTRPIRYAQHASTGRLARSVNRG